MESIENGKAALISGIEKDAKSEAENIISEAEKIAEEQRGYVEEQIRKIGKEAEQKSVEQAEAIKRKTLSGVDIEIKRQIMRIHDSLLKDIMSSVEERLLALIKTPQYRETLLNWCVEAALGLGVKSADVNASKDELPYIDQKFLSEVKERTKSIYGAETHLKLSEKKPLNRQGLVLTADDGRTAFNNQVYTRMLRTQGKNRKYIYDNLFTEE